jgi:hypothetical protein
MSDTFAGRWLTTYGPMELTQGGDAVQGEYGDGNLIRGRVAGRRLAFRYEEANVAGEGQFDLAPGGRSFRGEWRPDGDESWRSWTGSRLGFDGVWLTDFGHLRLVEEAGGACHGIYELQGGSTINGRISGDTLSFTYQEPDARGEGRFTLSPDGLGFDGQWRPAGASEARPWRGRRLTPTGQAWLAVLEVPWHGMADVRDYSFGTMLRDFFARHPHVQTRVRNFANEAALRSLCRELWYVPDPVMLVVASHGKEQGIHLDGAVIRPSAFEDALRYVPDLQVLHFSACLMMKEDAVVEGWRQLAGRLGAIVSGYATSVNWAASAIIEFTYLELIFAQGLSPARAAEALPNVLPFAGAAPTRGPGFPAAGFRYVTPDAP